MDDPVEEVGFDNSGDAALLKHAAAQQRRRRDLLEIEADECMGDDLGGIHQVRMFNEEFVAIVKLGAERGRQQPSPEPPLHEHGGMIAMPCEKLQ